MSLAVALPINFSLRCHEVRCESPPSVSQFALPVFSCCAETGPPSQNAKPPAMSAAALVSFVFMSGERLPGVLYVRRGRRSTTFRRCRRVSRGDTTEGMEGTEKIHKRRNGVNGDETEKTGFGRGASWQKMDG